MKTRALALIALAVGLSGCRENLTSIQANGFCWPPEDAAVCGVPSCDTMVSGFKLGGGTAGAAVLRSWIEWQNNMPNNAVDGERLNTNDFTIDGYEWEIKSPVRTTTIRDTRASTMLIKAGGGTGIVALEVIPLAGTAALSDDHTIWESLSVPPRLLTDEMPVRVNIKAFGTKGDDSYYETGTVSAAVDYFSGLVTYACPTSTDTLVGTCPPDASQQPVTLNCEAPPTTTP